MAIAPPVNSGTARTACVLPPIRIIQKGRSQKAVRASPHFLQIASEHAAREAADMQHSGLAIEQVSVRSLKPYPRNARRHSKDQVKQIAASITRFGFNNPILIADDGEIVAGHGRLAAAKLLGLETVPTLRLSHLTEAERRAYVIADNKLALNAGWDREMLAIELQGLVDLDFEIELTGFSLAEVDIVLDEARESATEGADATAEDTIPIYRHDVPAVSKMGDLWLLGRHKLICGDARDAGAYDLLMGGDAVDLICTDPPYNVPIDGHVCGSGRIRHRDFAMGVGEMNKDQFTRFLVDTLGLAAARCRDGAIAFVFMDWRHIGDLLSRDIPYRHLSEITGTRSTRAISLSHDSVMIWLGQISPLTPLSYSEHPPQII
jgi:hypothetical protein